MKQLPTLTRSNSVFSSKESLALLTPVELETSREFKFTSFEPTPKSFATVNYNNNTTGGNSYPKDVNTQHAIRLPGTRKFEPVIKKFDIPPPPRIFVPDPAVMEPTFRRLYFRLLPFDLNILVDED
jgi:hypothetical protein